MKTHVVVVVVVLVVVLVVVVVVVVVVVAVELVVVVVVVGQQGGWLSSQPAANQSGQHKFNFSQPSAQVHTFEASSFCKRGHFVTKISASKLLHALWALQDGLQKSCTCRNKKTALFFHQNAVRF